MDALNMDEKLGLVSSCRKDNNGRPGPGKKLFSLSKNGCKLINILEEIESLGDNDGKKIDHNRGSRA